MRIRDFPKFGSAPAGLRYRDLFEADAEAGQEKLRSAVEWGLYRKHCAGRGSGSLLNLKPACSEGFFQGAGQSLKITSYPGVSDPLGWLRSLPADSFDAIFGLDFLGSVADTGASIRELGRSLKSGGVLLLNFFSADHFALADSLPASGNRLSVRDRAAMPAQAITPAGVGELATAGGLAVTGIIPYSSFYGNSLWLELMESRFRWERILDWLSSDARLFDFALFLEESIIANLASDCAPRFAAVLEKCGEGR
ncbi:MAG: hypothetical protein ABI036_00045, partial [Fibrobacteria bacterium]